MKYVEKQPVVEVDIEFWDPEKGHVAVAREPDDDLGPLGTIHQANGQTRIRAGWAIVTYDDGQVAGMPADVAAASFDPVVELTKKASRALKEDNA